MVRRPSVPPDFDEILYTASGMDDFFEITSGQMWTPVGDGTAAIVSSGYYSRGGILHLDVSVVENDEEYLISTNAMFGFRRGVQWGMEVRYKWYSFAEGGGNVIFGFLQDAAADSILDNGAGLMAGKHVAAIAQFDSEKYLRCISGQTLDSSRINTLTTHEGATTNSASTSAASETAFKTLRIEMMGGQIHQADSTLGDDLRTRFSIDPTGKGAFEPLRNIHGEPIMHVVGAQANIANDMKLICGFKIGTQGASELYIDYVRWWVTRGGA
jgi:hypothetical protein